MTDVPLTVHQRAFPSRGRARIHESVLSALQLKEGDEIELFTGDHPSPVLVAAYADSLVGEDEIRLSPEDMASLNVSEGATVTARKRPPAMERMKQTAAGLETGLKKTEETAKAELARAGKQVKEGAARVGAKLRKDEE
jgi:hypothetical protein